MRALHSVVNFYKDTWLTKVSLAPMDLAMALAQGFHNAPRLYGDDTVRKPVRITGCHSGLRAAWSEFIYEVSYCI